ncbi:MULTISPECIES: Eco57I restriction-modification methylase domain-containing protein [Pseudanabaena]|uniref:Eco57I restriction-modification methylase domain-containing protein n=1 Tax=Pseudanabaena TaxID=1152 RepID=UPI00247A28AE|nr:MULTISPECIES: TaqI-like C-terminal specificity domain-containing protein [Pseudanabaena]MEA5485227.1 TaqI-like C-terminal specificity domain-containing protein [Pseudanabaena sp. CCNP1317]WGS72642.1 Eco57I restriction-modification methylase domain-containing protein [Pseudanabaena galeata CCNP1313]
MPEIKQLFSNAYNRASWKQFLAGVFVGADLFLEPNSVDVDTHVATSAQRLGFIKINEDGIEKQIVLYEVTLADGIILERNRVGLRNALRKHYGNYAAAFIVYHRPEDRNWRLTYVSEFAGTEPKRYTYVLGEGETVRTAVSRFEKIQEKGRGVSLDDVKDAFSVEKLSKVFFGDYKKHYEDFCNHMLADPYSYQTIFKGDEKGIRDFSKKLLGRIVFLYFIQKKGWLGVKVGDAWGKGDFNFLTDLFQRNKALFYEQLLSPLFFDTLNTKRDHDVIELVAGEPCRIPYLNGGLFEEDDRIHRSLVFPVQLFEKLFEFFNQYNFTIYEDDPNDHTVAVDPEMLGHIFENLLEDNKDKGAFYTPKEIVHYMCQESLIEYLTTWFENNGYKVVGFVTIGKPEQPSLLSENTVREGQLELEVPVEAESNTKQINRVLIEKLLKKTLSDDERLLVGGYADKFNVALDAVKICDPAIGSGAFPMGLLHEIFTTKQTLYGIVHGNANGFAASEVKLNIIQNSIYGVDIERGAVDIARLRFWLSLIVDESDPKPLPNLDYKIVVGNSLVSKLDDQVIDLDWGMKGIKQTNILYDVSKPERILRSIGEKQREFFSPDSNKKQLSSEIRDLKIDLLISQLELMIKDRGLEAAPIGTGKKLAEETKKHLQTLGWKSTISQLKKLRAKPDGVLNFFDWKLDFPEVMNERVCDQVGFDIVIGNPPYKIIFDTEEKKVLEDKFPTFKRNNDLYVAFFEKCFKLLKNKSTLSFITPNTFINGDYFKPLRKEITSYFWIMELIGFKESKVFSDPTVYVSISFFKKINQNEIDNKNTKLKLSNEDFSSTIVKNITLKLSSEEAFKESNYLLDRFNKNYLDEFFYVKDVGFKYWSIGKGKKRDGNSIGDRILYSGKQKDIKDLPFIKGKDISKNFINEPSHFLRHNYNDYLVKGIDIFRYSQEFLQINPKIVYRQTSNKIIAALDTSKYLCDKTVHIIVPRQNQPYSLILVLALINSNLFDYFYKFISQETDGRAFAQVKATYIKKLPLPNIDRLKGTSIYKVANEVVTLKSEGKDTTALEQQIDNLVYKLYELTYQEVKASDPEFELTEQEYTEIKME